jgi:probable rRNA maturation factor
MSVELDILIEDARWADEIATLAEPAVVAALEGVGLDPSAFEVSLLACDDARIAALNEDFRQKGQPTNVLSWPSDERGVMADGEMPLPPKLPMDAELGDIAISYDTCAREAAEAGKPFAHHVTHLIVHGTLHLLGFDHIRDRDAALMEALETEILGKLDIPDPYS